MKKVISIFLIIFVILSIFTVTVSAESLLLRAGGSVGGGGGFGGFFRDHSSNVNSQGFENMNGEQILSAVVVYLVYIGYIAVHIAAAVLIPIIVHKRKKKAREETRRLMAEYDDFDGFWSYEYVQSRIEEIYFAVQNAWRDGDMKNAEDMLTSALFKKYQKYLSAQRRDGEKNVMKNIQLKSAMPVYAKDFTNNEHDYLWIKIEGSMIDYIINIDTGDILQGTQEDMPFTEYWRLTRRKDGMWVLAEIMQTEQFEKTRYYKGLSKI